jgi:hypothetical protein
MLLNGAVATSIETFHPDREAEFGEKRTGTKIFQRIFRF